MRGYSLHNACQCARAGGTAMQRCPMTLAPARRGYRGENSMQIRIAFAAGAALVACSGQESTGANESRAVAPAAATAGLDGAASQGRLPPAPYRAYFEERDPGPA